MMDNSPSAPNTILNSVDHVSHFLYNFPKSYPRAVQFLALSPPCFVAIPPHIISNLILLPHTPYENWHWHWEAIKSTGSRISRSCSRKYGVNLVLSCSAEFYTLTTLPRLRSQSFRFPSTSFDSIVLTV